MANERESYLIAAGAAMRACDRVGRAVDSAGVASCVSEEASCNIPVMMQWARVEVMRVLVQLAGTMNGCGGPVRSGTSLIRG
jgi:predicted RNA methylase